MARVAYQYETSPRKYENSYRRRKRESIRLIEEQRQKVSISEEEKKRQVKITITVIAVFAVLLTISYRNSLINERFNSYQKIKTELSALQKENEQVKVSIANGLNSNYIEQQAKEKLGMKKLSNKQTIYMTLPKKDYVESPAEKVVIEEEKEKNIFEKIIGTIFGE